MKTNEEIINEALSARDLKRQEDLKYQVASILSKFPDAVPKDDGTYDLAGYNFSYFERGVLIFYDNDGWPHTFIYNMSDFADFVDQQQILEEKDREWRKLGFFGKLKYFLFS